MTLGGAKKSVFGYTLLRFAKTSRQISARMATSTHVMPPNIERHIPAMAPPPSRARWRTPTPNKYFFAKMKNFPA
jgi:hypothetical protein